jgi:hypothetical protein
MTAVMDPVIRPVMDTAHQALVITTPDVIKDTVVTTQAEDPLTLQPTEGGKKI